MAGIEDHFRRQNELVREVGPELFHAIEFNIFAEVTFDAVIEPYRSEQAPVIVEGAKDVSGRIERLDDRSCHMICPLLRIFQLLHIDRVALAMDGKEFVGFGYESDGGWHNQVELRV